MSVDEGYESDEDLLDVDDIGKASDFPLPLYLPDDDLSKSNEIDNISAIIESVATASPPSTDYRNFKE
jgi:hypothetical protein